jgi:hypothetical protein
MTTSRITFNSLDESLTILKRQKIVLKFVFLLPPLLVSGIIGALFYYQGKLYPNNWYNDPFTIVIISLFIAGQTLGFIQYFKFYKKTILLTKLNKVIGEMGSVSSTQDIKTLSDLVSEKAPKIEEKSLVLNWLDFGLKNNRSSSAEITDNAFNRQELEKEKTGYLHILINRVTLKLGFLGTLIGLMMTFPAMKSAILGLNQSNGEMTFITDIARAIDGDQYAILTTMIATILSLFAEFITIQIITRISINFEIIMSHLTDWYHSTIVPLLEVSDDNNMELVAQKKALEQSIAENIATLTALSQRTAVELEKMTTFQENLTERVDKLDKYEQNYRDFLASKQGAVAPNKLTPSIGSL